VLSWSLLTLDDRDDDAPADLVDADVLVETGRVERLQGLVDLHGVEPLARTEAEIAADGIGVDPLVALHVDRLGIGDSGHREAGDERDCRGCESQAHHDRDPPENPHPIHA
jgi:hypothetical protein